jgi:hypothetical protein
VHGSPPGNTLVSSESYQTCAFFLFFFVCACDFRVVYRLRVPWRRDKTRSKPEKKEESLQHMQALTCARTPDTAGDVHTIQRRSTQPG